MIFGFLTILSKLEVSHFVYIHYNIRSGIWGQSLRFRFLFAIEIFEKKLTKFWIFISVIFVYSIGEIDKGIVIL